MTLEVCTWKREAGSRGMAYGTICGPFQTDRARRDVVGYILAQPEWSLRMI